MNTEVQRRQELELLQETLALLSQRVDSMEAYMNQQSISVESMVTTLKRIISNGS